MIWSGDKTVIKLKELILELEGMEERFFDHCNIIEQEVGELVKRYDTKSKVKKKERNQFLISYEQVLYKSNGFSLHVLELLKNTKYFIEGFKYQYDEHVTLNVEEFKYKRRRFKKKNKQRIQKAFKKYADYKANRNLIAHNCIAKLNLYVISNQQELAVTINECKEMLLEIHGSISEYEKAMYEKDSKIDILSEIGAKIKIPIPILNLEDYGIK